MRRDQDKSGNTPEYEHERFSKVKSLRQELRSMCRLLGRLERNEDDQGSTLPNSYSQAIVILLDYHVSDRRPTLSDLVDLLAIDKSNVTRLCQRLEESGYIELKRDPKDRRAKRIHLTPEGVTFAKEVDASSLELFSNIVENFPQHQRQTLLELLARLNQTMREQTE